MTAGRTNGRRAGRQLKSMTHRDELGVQDKKLEFSYDAVGLRTQKKYTYADELGQAVVETTDYILHGKMLTHQKTMTTIDGVEQEPYQLHFYYDKDSCPIMVRVGNEEAESQYYTYVHSIQGDILGIIDGAQDLVVEYAYDPWGKPLETRCLKTGCEMLAEMNPFRYKGYQYDGETAYYYLRSRYYDPGIGRFINPDSIVGSGGLLASSFAYCCNSPIRIGDPFGQDGKDFTRSAARQIIANPASVWLAQNPGWLGEKLFWAAGFARENKGEYKGVFHARVDALQQFGGYNSFYDTVFDYSTKMKFGIYEFKYDGQDYRLWAWKGDYLNLGGGAELGIYKRMTTFAGDTNHWLADPKNLTLPMTMTLSYKGKTIASYSPSKPQWWITSFNPFYQGVDPDDLSVSYTVDFSGNTGMYDEFSAAWRVGDTPWMFDIQNYTATLSF